MVFSSLIFLNLFFPVTLAVYYLLPGKIRNLWLAAASIAFYAFGEPKFVYLFLAEIVWNWLLALWISRVRRPAGKKLILSAGLLGDLGVLFLFKYSGFLVRNLRALSGISPALPAFVLPIGISFYTFQAVSYLADVYRGEEPQRNLADLALYLAFFPQLIAGPIVRYREIRPQLRNRASDWGSVSSGFIRFCSGLCKKVLLANQLGALPDYVFGTAPPESLSAPVLWLGAAAYSLQLFYDFSGYSDMAIGLGSMFGFRLPENFRDPYTARTGKEFWNRWHISLSAWFRDYVYIPLGGSRNGIARTVRNILFVWTLTGLWHGAEWTFVFWGLCWGLLLVLERYLFRPESRTRSFRACYRLALALCTVLLWTVFRSPDLQSAFTMLGRMFSPSAWVLVRSQLPMLRMWWHDICPYLLAGLLLAFCIPQKCFSAFLAGKEIPPWLYCLKLLGLAACTVLAWSFLVNGSYNPFLYFQF